MNKFSSIVLALAMVITLSQCKKNEPVVSHDGSDGVFITLEVRDDGNAKSDVNTTTGAVTYTVGDAIHVANNGKYVGTLTYNGTVFTGTIANATDGLPLQFYFCGNVNPEETLVSGVTNSCSVDISDQTEHLPVISCAPSDELYNAATTYYTAHLLNKCALVKFNVQSFSSDVTVITGVKNKVTIDFGSGDFSYGRAGSDFIKLPAGSGERWAILLPQNAVGAGVMGTAYSMDYLYTGTRGAIPAITNNAFLTVGINVTINTSSAIEVPEGAVAGKFTLNSGGGQVYFSKGNLQYIGSDASPYWKFADHQWDFLGVSTGQNSNSQTANRDLFGWGTSGYNHGAVCYKPWSTSTISSDYYAYGSVSNYLSYGSGNADWGYNKISNGGNEEGMWRTLSNSEWQYIIYSRSTISGYRYARATVNGVKGMIIFPDDWKATIFSPVSPNTNDAPFDSNVISDISVWNTFQANGAVFMPAAGLRNGTDVFNQNVTGTYWLSSNSGVNADIITIARVNSTGSMQRSSGCSVRLVQDME